MSVRVRVSVRKGSHKAAALQALAPLPEPFPCPRAVGSPWSYTQARPSPGSPPSPRGLSTQPPCLPLASALSPGTLADHHSREQIAIAPARARSPVLAADFVALDRDILDATATPDAQIWQTAILGTWSGGVAAWRHPCMRRAQLHGLGGARTSLSTQPGYAARGNSHGNSPAQRGLAALRECVEAERARAPPLESTLARLQRLSAAHGDGCPF